MGRCNACNKDEKEVIKNEFMLEFMDQIAYFRKPMDEKIFWMKLRIEKKFAV